MTRELVIIHHLERPLMRLATAFSEMGYQTTAVDSTRSIRSARRLAERTPAAMIISLDGTENVAELRELVSPPRTTTFVFLLAAMPPRAALARLLAECGSAALSQSESPIVIAATLIGLSACTSSNAT
ncbi:MAG: hypothetical protein HYX50_00625 [Chloroflexi bacterium]|nr:hypothetical protein [Chloroflexota bacterium]